MGTCSSTIVFIHYDWDIHYVWDIAQVGNSEGHGDSVIDCMEVDDDVYEIENGDDSDWDETENRISVSFT